MNAETTATVKQLLAQPKSMVIIGHKNPDGDAVGSCLGLYFFMKSMGHDAQVIMPNDFPDFLRWMPGTDSILIHEKNVTESQAAIAAAEVIFTLDFNAFNRVGDVQSALEASTAEFIMIDHHQQPADYATAMYSDVSMSSTAEMVYHFIEALNGLQFLTADISTLLYTGIMTDTGSFRYPSTSAMTHKVIANLMEHGANNSYIHEHIYDTNSPNKMKLLGVALNNLHILKEYKTAYITLTQKELDENNFKKGDTEGFVNYALSVQGIVFAVIFIEHKQDKIVKMSLRSKGEFSVNEFARAHYSGGGHTNAAGGRSTCSMKETVSEFISILPTYKKALT